MPTLNLLSKSEEIKIDALKSFGRTPQILESDIQSIKEWAKKQPHLPEIPSDNHITGFLLLSKFEFAKAKRMIDTYYTIRGIVPELYKDPESPECITAMDLMYWIPLPKATDAGSRVILNKLRKKSDTQPFDGEAYVANIFNLIEILFIEDHGSNKIYILDGINIQIEHVSSVSPSVFKKIYHAFEEVHSGQLLQMHFLNIPSIMEPIITLMKSFMKQKVADKIHYHKNIESLLEYVPKEILPQNYGGEEESLETLHDLWRKKVKDLAPYLRKQNLLRTDESKRLEESPLDSELQGLEGNFRKLNVD